jgi:tRNA A37 N6-isopentenylltransferase MiaA
MTLETRRYAKRQRTWFRRLEDALWIDGSEATASLVGRVLRFLEEGSESPRE